MGVAAADTGLLGTAPQMCANSIGGLLTFVLTPLLQARAHSPPPLPRASPQPQYARCNPPSSRSVSP